MKTKYFALYAELLQFVHDNKPAVLGAGYSPRTGYKLTYREVTK